MSAGFPGLCEWCGSTQHWTLFGDDVVYVSCDAECDPQIELFEGATLRDSEKLIIPERKPKMELPEARRVGTPEGGDVDEDKESVLVQIGVPLEAVLHNLWVGGPDGETFSE